jgi:muramoyltetrapeptide carboxypeptidase LdcA involved in peptidoglycan recycling
MNFSTLQKLTPGDSVGIVSPAFVAPAFFPAEYELGLSRLRDQFGLNPVEMPHVRNANASHQDKMDDLVKAFTDPSIKAVIATIGGDLQIEYVHKLPTQPFKDSVKPFFGYSDNTQLNNFLFLNRIPSFYGGCIYTEFGMQGQMDLLTESYLKTALFENSARRLASSTEFNDEDLPWGVPENISRRRRYQPNEGWKWNGLSDGAGYLWGGCLESLDEILRHGRKIPSLSEFEQIVLFFETCEELAPAHYVNRVLRAFGELGILERIQGVLVGRPKAWNFDTMNSDEQKEKYKTSQHKTILDVVRRYNASIPVVQNLDFGHTAPFITLPVGGKVEIVSSSQSITAYY